MEGEFRQLSSLCKKCTGVFCMLTCMCMDKSVVLWKLRLQAAVIKGIPLLAGVLGYPEFLQVA